MKSLETTEFQITMLLIAIVLLAVGSAPRAAVAATPGRQALRILDAAGREVGVYENSFALVIGIADYRAGWPLLPGVHEDVQAVSEVLEEHGFHVRSERNLAGQALDQVLRQFIAERGQVSAGRVLIYFAGHGHTERQSLGGEKMGYLVPADAPLPEEDWQGFIQRALPMAQIEAYAKEIRSRHALFLFDSCFAGSIFTSRGPGPWDIGATTLEPVRQFITSGTADEQVPDKSIFRHQLVAALRGQGDLNQDGYVTGSELGHHLFREVVKYSRERQHPQHGRLRLPGQREGDFVFQVGKPAPRSASLAAPPPPAPQSVWTERSVDMRFRYIPAGSFQTEELATVAITRGFWMSETEVTQKQWRKLKLRKRNPSRFQQCGGDCPVEQVNWWEAVRFANRLSQTAGLETCYEFDCQGTLGKDFTCRSATFRGLDCQGYRLPSEAEWQWAARGADTSVWAGDLSVHGDCDAPRLAEIAWFCGNSAGATRAAAGKQANARGLHDMLGNVWEWVQDIVERGEEAPSFSSASSSRRGSREALEEGRRRRTDGMAVGGGIEDPLSTRGTARVVRGGGFADTVHDCRAAARRTLNPGERLDSVGFRLVRTAP